MKIFGFVRRMISDFHQRRVARINASTINEHQIQYWNHRNVVTRTVWINHQSSSCRINHATHMPSDTVHNKQKQQQKHFQNEKLNRYNRWEMKKTIRKTETKMKATNPTITVTIGRHSKFMFDLKGINVSKSISIWFCQSTRKKTPQHRLVERMTFKLIKINGNFHKLNDASFEIEINAFAYSSWTLYCHPNSSIQILIYQSSLALSLNTIEDKLHKNQMSNKERKRNNANKNNENENINSPKSRMISQVRSKLYEN